jgi:peptidyl-prolyl cis-trans isomerase SurA
MHIYLPRSFSLLVLTLVSSLTFSGVPALCQEVVDRIVAVVNGEVITLFELNQRFRPVLDQFQGQNLGDEEKRLLLDSKRQLLDRMVEEVLLRQEAGRLNMAVTDMEVQTQLRQVREQFGLSEAQFSEQLTLQGLTREGYEQRIREEMLRHRLMNFMIRRKVVVTSDEIREYYETHQSEFMQQQRVHLGMILFASQTQAEEVQARLRNEELSFADAAGQYSQGPGAAQGGDIGMLAWKDLAADWRGALESLEVGEISPIIQVRNQPAILKLFNMEAGDVLSLDQVEDQIREKLMEPRLNERYNEYMAGLRSRALIDIRL